MGKYLDIAEVPQFCEYFADDITETTIGFAEQLIDSYLGESLEEKTTVETVKVNRKNTGKLQRGPVTTIVNAIGYYRTRGGLQEATIDPQNISVTTSGYFELIPMVPQLNIFSFYRCSLYSIKFEYKHGLSPIPKQLKNVVAMICQNIAEKKTFGNLKGYTTIDVQMTLFDDSVFTKDIRMMLDGVKYGAY